MCMSRMVLFRFGYLGFVVWWFGTRKMLGESLELVSLIGRVDLVGLILVDVKRGLVLCCGRFGFVLCVVV